MKCKRYIHLKMENWLEKLYIVIHKIFGKIKVVVFEVVDLIKYLWSPKYRSERIYYNNGSEVNLKKKISTSILIFISNILNKYKKKIVAPTVF